MKFKCMAAVLFLSSCLGVVPAAADQVCNVPLTDWQPRQALQNKLETEGWTVLSIRSDDGCYKIKAMKAGGERIKEKYNPATLERIQMPPDAKDD